MLIIWTSYFQKINLFYEKIIIILTLNLLISSNLFPSEASNQNKFNQWLLKNGHTQYLEGGG